MTNPPVLIKRRGLTSDFNLYKLITFCIRKGSGLGEGHGCGLCGKVGSSDLSCRYGREEDFCGPVLELEKGGGRNTVATFLRRMSYLHPPLSLIVNTSGGEIHSRCIVYRK